MSIVAGVYGLPVHFSGWNTKFIRKDLNGKEAYHCASYDLFNFNKLYSYKIPYPPGAHKYFEFSCKENNSTILLTIFCLFL